MTLLPEPLREVRRLGFDTAPVIYFVEAHPEYDAQITPIFERIRQGELEGVYICHHALGGTGTTDSAQPYRFGE